MKYPNYRVVVEGIIVQDNKVLIAKRSLDCKVAPGVWNVPAGKVKYEEIPSKAIVRELKEETRLDINIIKELSVRAFKFELDGEDAFRLVFTYLVEVVGENKTPIINEEHSTFKYVSLEELDNKEYNNMNKDLKNIIKTVLNN